MVMPFRKSTASESMCITGIAPSYIAILKASSWISRNRPVRVFWRNTPRAAPPLATMITNEGSVEVLVNNQNEPPTLL